LSGEEAHSILVVDDEKSMREFLEIMLTQEGYRVTLAESGETAGSILDKQNFDLVITDIRMKDMDGIGVLKKAKAVNPNAMVVLISAFATAETAVEAMKEGAYDYIPKPFKVKDFKRIVKEALRSRKPAEIKEEEHLKRRYHFERFVGESPQMKKVYDLVKRVAHTRTNILISGESGTGKELAARAIHELSQRREKSFVVINCAGMPENLIESELFGYKKGAFTGAGSDKQGLFDVADGGTVFLDEVGDLTPAIQVKLLRVIQERTFTAVGDTEEKNVDVRFISASNKDLENEVIEKNFREDLYFRLNVINIDMPPLRERDGDLPLLAQHFLERYSLEFGKDIRKILPMPWIFSDNIRFLAMSENWKILLREVWRLSPPTSYCRKVSLFPIFVRNPAERIDESLIWVLRVLSLTGQWPRSKRTILSGPWKWPAAQSKGRQDYWESPLIL